MLLKFLNNRDQFPIILWIVMKIKMLLFRLNNQCIKKHCHWIRINIQIRQSHAFARIIFIFKYLFSLLWFTILIIIRVLLYDNNDQFFDNFRQLWFSVNIKTIFTLIVFFYKFNGFLIRKIWQFNTKTVKFFDKIILFNQLIGKACV